ncbi:hypothetical protein C8J57DRAFT_1509713 [Mycena rebaudengoi]|nr:hypothetical protein C8J57DRAFT_1509713 [Mycena rebaudengoi]
MHASLSSLAQDVKDAPSWLRLWTLASERHTSLEKMHLWRLGRLGKDAKDVKDKRVVLLMSLPRGTLYWLLRALPNLSRLEIMAVMLPSIRRLHLRLIYGVPLAFTLRAAASVVVLSLCSISLRESAVLCRSGRRKLACAIFCLATLCTPHTSKGSTSIWPSGHFLPAHPPPVLHRIEFPHLRHIDCRIELSTNKVTQDLALQRFRGSMEAFIPWFQGTDILQCSFYHPRVDFP